MAKPQKPDQKHDQKHNQKPDTNDRREFLKIGGLGTIAALVGARVVSYTPTAQAQGAKPAGTPANLVMMKETDPMAVALGYKEDATKVDTKKFPKRAGAEGAKQFCWNCQLYQHTPKEQSSKSNAAVCTIFAGKGAAAKGWCNSWVHDPKAK